MIIKGETVSLKGAIFTVVDFNDIGHGWFDAILEKPHMPGTKWYGKIRLKVTR